MKKFVSYALLCLVTAGAGHAADAAWNGGNGASAGAVFVATNDAKRNEVVMYARSATGVL